MTLRKTEEIFGLILVVNLKPDEKKEKDDFSVSDTGGSEEKNRVLVIGVERMTFWLLVSVASLVFCSSVVERHDAAYY